MAQGRAFPFFPPPVRILEWNGTLNTAGCALAGSALHRFDGETHEARDRKDCRCSELPRWLAACPKRKPMRSMPKVGASIRICWCSTTAVTAKRRVWLSQKCGERLEDGLGGPTTLHAHSRDAAQQGFYQACKTAKACRELGLDVKYPRHPQVLSHDHLETYGHPPAGW